MRPIKFRAWDKTAKEMFYSDFHIGCYGKIYWWDSDGYNRVRDDVEIMQFTGLHDKNGNEIYEGDIVKHYDNAEHIYKIDMSELDYLDPLNDEASDHTGDMSPDALHSRPNNFEVIGNVFENPELIETNL